MNFDHFMLYISIVISSDNEIKRKYTVMRVMKVLYELYYFSNTIARLSFLFKCDIILEKDYKSCGEVVNL